METPHKCLFCGATPVPIYATSEEECSRKSRYLACKCGVTSSSPNAVGKIWDHPVYYGTTRTVEEADAILIRDWNMVMPEKKSC